MLIGFLSLLGRQPQSTLSVCVVACSVYTGRPSPAILSGLASRCQLTQQRDPFQHQDGTRLMRLAAGKSREYDKLVTGRAADRCTGHCEHEYGSSDVYQLACRLNTSRTPGHSWNDSMDQRSLLACAVLMVLGLIFSVNRAVPEAREARAPSSPDLSGSSPSHGSRRFMQPSPGIRQHAVLFSCHPGRLAAAHSRWRIASCAGNCFCRYSWKRMCSTGIPILSNTCPLSKAIGR